MEKFEWKCRMRILHTHKAASDALLIQKLNKLFNTFLCDVFRPGSLLTVRCISAQIKFAATFDTLCRPIHLVRPSWFRRAAVFPGGFASRLKRIFSRTESVRRAATKLVRTREKHKNDFGVQRFQAWKPNFSSFLLTFFFFF